MIYLVFMLSVSLNEKVAAMYIILCSPLGSSDWQWLFVSKLPALLIV